MDLGPMLIFVVLLGSLQKQADVNTLLLLLGLFCHVLPLLFRHVGRSTVLQTGPMLALSRASSIIMLIACFAYLVFQLWTHRQLFEAQEDTDVASDEGVVIGFWSGLTWLVGMTTVIALLSQNVVGTIEVPLCVLFAWIMGIKMDLDFNTLETGALALSIIITSFALQRSDGSSHYMKGLVLLLCYIVIGATFFVLNTPLQHQADVLNLGNPSTTNNRAFNT
ncbi:hypothetical protein Ancab_021762 [Ancistrocladus abbreviatus]